MSQLYMIISTMPLIANTPIWYVNLLPNDQYANRWQGWPVGWSEYQGSPGGQRNNDINNNNNNNNNNNSNNNNNTNSINNNSNNIYNVLYHSVL